MADWDALPEDLWTEILFKIPPRNVVQLKLLCKKVHSAITCSTFGARHFQINKTVLLSNLDGDDDEDFKETKVQLLTLKPPTAEGISGNINIYYNRKCSNLATISNNLRLEPLEGYNNFEVIGNINGMLLFHQKWNSTKSLLLLNPMTQEYYRIPNSECSKDMLWAQQIDVSLVYDDKNNDHKVVFIINPRFNKVASNETKMEVFSLKNKVWQEKPLSFPGNMRLGPKLNFNGEIHWVVGTSPDVEIEEFTHLLSFNIENELFSWLKLRKANDIQAIVPIVYQNSLGLVDIHFRDVRAFRMRVWKVLKDNKVQLVRRQIFSHKTLCVYQFSKVVRAIYFTSEGQESLLFVLQAGSIVKCFFGYEDLEIITGL